MGISIGTRLSDGRITLETGSLKAGKLSAVGVKVDVGGFHVAQTTLDIEFVEINVTVRKAAVVLAKVTVGAAGLRNDDPEFAGALTAPLTIARIAGEPDLGETGSNFFHKGLHTLGPFGISRGCESQDAQ